MSGDVQPRKRKDKKKKREDDEASHGVHMTKMGTDDVHLHVQHDHGTGGHWCAKIIFFSLMTILLGLVALILLENRGLSDLDTPLSESRFSTYFDGWVDEHRPDEHDHDEHDSVQASAEGHDDHDDDDDDDDDEHGEPYEEEEDHTGEDDEGDGDGDDEDDAEHTQEDDDDDDDQQDEEVEATAEEDDNNDDDDDNDNDDGDDDQDDNADDDNDEDNDAENTEEVTQEQTVEDDADDDEEDANEDNDDNDDDDEQATQEEATAEVADEENTQEDDEDNDNNDDDDDGDDNDDDVQNDAPDDDDDDEQKTKEDNDDNDNGDNNDDDDDDDDDADADDDGDSNVVDNDAEELLLLQEKAKQQAAQAGNNAGDPKSTEDDGDDKADDSIFAWASSLAGKIGVGLALAFVARLLLLRKNPNASDEPPPEVIMRRRLTIAAPEDIFPDDEQPPYPDDDEYVEEEVIIEEEIEYVEDGDEIPIEQHDDAEHDDAEHDDDEEEHDDDGKKAYVPETFEQLNAMYRPAKYEETQPQAPPPAPPPAPAPVPAPKPFAPISQRFKERFEEPHHSKIATTTASEAAKRAAAPVFTAPPPPPLHEEKIQLHASSSPNGAASSRTQAVYNPNADAKSLYIPTAKATPEIPKSLSEQEVTTREVTHDVDYQPEDDEIDYNADEHYDDEEYINDEEESSLDGDDEEDDDEISDVDDTELMNRLEAKYGKIETKEYESDEDPEDPTWTQIKPKETAGGGGGGGGAQMHADDDDSFERELREANEELMRENYNAAFKAFNLLCERYPDKPRAFLGKAQSLNQLAEKQHSNKLLHLAIEAFKRYLAFDELVTDDSEYRSAAERCIERMRFMGEHIQTLPLHNQLIARFPNDAAPRNQLAVTHLLLNHLTDAKRILQATLQRWPSDGFAQVHYGFVLKQLEQDYENAVIYLRSGIQSNADGTQDGRFYFNLGDALQRLGRQAEALEIYERGAQLQLFPSAYQRSLYNEANLRAQPFWSKEETTYAKFLHKLEQNWLAIRDEGLSVLGRKGYFEDESENLRDHGEWQQFELFARGQRQFKNCQKAPITCGIIQEFKAASSCRRGQVKFSVLHPNTHVWPHCGPTNCRLRAHLGLVVPEGTLLRVANQYRSWKEGEFLIFDDSFEHEVWHNGTSLRLVLIVDIWHPDLTEKQRLTLSSI